ASIANDHGGRASLKKGGSDYGRKLVGVTTLRARYSFPRPSWVSRHHMTGVMTLMADCFIRGFGVGVATSEAFHRLLGLD
ncbi:hypothetical protein Gotur_001420, partial [Gossypium turneri]